MTPGSTVSIPCAAYLVVSLAVALVSGCSGHPPGPTPAESTAALTAVVGALPDGSEILFFERRGGAGGAWVIRTTERWQPHGVADHRHVTLPTDTFMNLVAATALGKVDPGRPAEGSCRYTEWQASAADAAGRRDIRIFQLATDRGELTVLESLPDPTGG
jgi:hypothetical protein